MILLFLQFLQFLQFRDSHPCFDSILFAFPVNWLWVGEGDLMEMRMAIRDMLTKGEKGVSLDLV